MSLVRLLGYTTLDCGCVVGRYRDMGSVREVHYVEEKGLDCATAGHRRNQPMRRSFERVRSSIFQPNALRAS